MADFCDLGQALTERNLDAALFAHKQKSATKKITNECVVCDEPIPLARQKATDGTDKCIDCARHSEKYWTKKREDLK